MKIPVSMPRLKGFRFPREIVAYAVWAYRRFALSTADAHESRTLAALRDTLLPKLISGEIRVTEAEKAMEAVA